jgi:hypothetical protein
MPSFRSLFALIAGFGAAVLAACAPENAPVSPEQLMAMIPTGQPLLTCRADCLAAWRTAEPQAGTLAASHRWTDLALLVLRVNYEDDLTVYYLAEAAQSMGYRTAAASYYRQSIELSGGPAACAVYSGLCGGVALPRAAIARLAALVHLVPRRAPVPREKPAPSVAEPPAPPAAPPAPPAEPPAPPAAPPVEIVPPAPASAPIRVPSHEEQQYIEPPPAPR